MNLDLINALRLIIIAFLSYIPTVALSGAFEAWVAKKVGDDLPDTFGFLTLNPLVHFDLIGFILMLFGLFFSFFSGMPGWGRYIPLDSSFILGRFRVLKIVLENFARALMHFFLFFITAFFLILSFKNIGGSYYFLNSASLLESLKSLFLFFLQQNRSLCIIYSIVGFYRNISFFFFERFEIVEPTNLVIRIAIFLFSMIIGWFIINRLLFIILISLEKVLIYKSF